MLEVVKSGRDRTCWESKETIPAGTFHFEVRGGPKTNSGGDQLNWVHFTSIESAARLIESARRRESRRRAREQRQHGHIWRV